jgi:hypothetical protein
VFDWYADVARDELGREVPIMLLRAGSIPGEMSGIPGNGALQHAHINLAIAQRFAGEGNLGEPMPEQVLACNYWLLAADKNSAYSSHAWFQADGSRLPVVDVFRQWVGVIQERSELVNVPPDAREEEATATGDRHPQGAPLDKSANADWWDNPLDSKIVAAEAELHPIAHYVLLPLYAWGAGEWDLELIEPYLQESHPTIGFSLAEARLARHVTVVAGPGAISDEILAMLRMAGCQVERLLADGTLIAT